MILFISGHYPNAFHTLVSTGVVNQNCKVLACYVGDLNEAAKEYDAVVKLQFESHDDANEFVSKQAQLLKSNKQSSPLIVFRSDTKTRLHDIVHEEFDFAETLRCFVGHSDDYYRLLTAKMKIMDVHAGSILMSINTQSVYPSSCTATCKMLFCFTFPPKRPDFVLRKVRVKPGWRLSGLLY